MVSPARLLRLAFRLAAMVVALAIIAGVAGLAVATRREALDLITNPSGDRTLPGQTPAAFGLDYEDVTVTTADGLALVGWFVPGVNGAVVMAQHGYKSNRGEMLNEAAMLRRHGYGVLLTTVRAHDRSGGERITFGTEEMQDFEAWLRYLRGRPDVNVTRIAMLGNSMGGTLAIQFAADNPAIRAVATNSAFSSITDTIETSVRFFTGLPPFPFAPMILFWAEQEIGFHAADIDAKIWISKLSPRPVLLMQGGNDSVISVDSGQRLFDAAGEPRELWFEPDIRHAGFDEARPGEYERRVVGFFDRYLQ